MRFHRSALGCARLSFRPGGPGSPPPRRPPEPPVPGPRRRPTPPVASPAMARPRTAHRCQECGVEAPRWTGRCPACGAWGSVVEEAAGRRRGDEAAAVSPVALEDIEPGAAAPAATGVGELDRVLGGGLVPGSVTLRG